MSNGHDEQDPCSANDGRGPDGGDSATAESPDPTTISAPRPDPQPSVRPPVLQPSPPDQAPKRQVWFGGQIANRLRAQETLISAVAGLIAIGAIVGTALTVFRSDQAAEPGPGASAEANAQGGDVHVHQQDGSWTAPETNPGDASVPGQGATGEPTDPAPGAPSVTSATRTPSTAGAPSPSSPESSTSAAPTSTPPETQRPSNSDPASTATTVPSPTPTTAATIARPASTPSTTSSPAEAATESPAPISFGQPNGGEFTGSLQEQRWQFAAGDQDALLIDVTELGEPGECWLDAEMVLEDRFGRTLQTESLANYRTCHGYRFALTGGGTYTLVWRTGTGDFVEQTAGSYRFEADFSAGIDSHPLQLGTATNGHIERLFGIDRWTFEVASPGANLVVEMITVGATAGSCEQDLEVRLIDPIGRPTTTQHVGWGCRTVEWELSETGTYILEFLGQSGRSVDPAIGPYLFVPTMT